MKKIKKVMALTVALCMVFALCACGGSSSKSSSSSDTSAKEASSSSAASSEASSEASSSAAADDGTVYSLDIDFPNPETASAFKALSDWADYLSEQTDGRLEINIYSGGALGALADCVDNCQSGVTDGFWSGVTIYPGVFPATEVMALPMIGAKDYKVVNKALNQLLEDYDVIADEWSQFKVVALHSSAGSPILFADSISDISEMKGKDLRISNAYTTQWFQDLGANPVSCGINDGYESIQKSVIEGGLFFFDQVESSALYEVIKSIYVGQTIYPLNMLCLNKEAYEALPADLQAAIDESGEYFLERSIYYFDEQVERMTAVLEDYDVNIIYEDDASIDFLSANVQNAWDKWVQTIDAAGLPGDEILATAQEYIEKFNAES